MSYSYPLDAVAAFVERLTTSPPGVQVRRWVLRDDNQQHHHGVVPVAEDPAYVELYWKPNARGQEQRVGLFRLHLARLLAAGYVRSERHDDADAAVRLRFYRGERNVVYIQARGDRLAVAIGTVDATDI